VPAARLCIYLLSALVVSLVALCALAAPVTPAYAETAHTAMEDAYVDSSLPTSNFGSSTLLSTDGTPRVTTYLKFNVSDTSVGCAPCIRRHWQRYGVRSQDCRRHELERVDDHGAECPGAR
jgi:hypothetical protein